ncbi:AraC family transcriptional regulator [Ktedonosporobacter rubrisoli]|uniref:AraC family transcriptional regulator n=1 Tax=Ktedonosporobacter rubrisoli TaxID=2509675 RepID=A0A4P6JRC5_KTERU|nr:AraC family transcriptional regulator [Ktedonosporobacter rubrisoli]QBD77843.1 AraC family transcriptional regulator [Ktedonosporobacter rubrisoli]
MKRQHLQERVEFWRYPEHENLEIMHATYFTHAFAPHSHSYFATSIIDRGVGTIWYRGTTHLAPAGSLVLLNPGEVHTGQVYSKNGWAYRALYPHMELIRSIAGNITERFAKSYFFPNPIITDPEIASFLHRLHAALVNEASTLERESWLLWSYTALLTRYAECPLSLPSGRKEPQAVKLAREYIEAHFAQNISLSQLASLTGLTSYHLVRVFHNTMGLPPHAYLNQIRLMQAKNLLLAGTPIISVASETGFTDQSHLTRRFKRVYGITPGQLLSSSKNMQD